MFFDQVMLTNNCSETLKQYMAQLKNLVVSTKKNSSLFNDIVNVLFGLLPEK